MAIPRSFIGRLGAALRQVPAYRASLGWMLRDLFRASPRDLFAMTAYSMLGATLRGLAFAAGIRYLQLLEQDAGFMVAGMFVRARDAAVMTWGTCGVIALLALSAWFLFRGRLTIARLLETYQAFQMRRILVQPPGALSDTRPPRDHGKAVELLARTVARDAQQCAVMVRFLGRSIPAVVTLTYAVPLIVYLDPPTTAALALLLAFAMPVFYRANVMAYESTVLGRSAQAETVNVLALRMSALQHASAPAAEFLPASAISGEAALLPRAGGLPMYLRSLARTEFGVNVLMSAALGLILVMQVPAAIAGEKNWALIIAYFVFLRLALDGLGILLNFTNIFSKLYPAVRRYQRWSTCPGSRAAAPAEPVIALHDAIMCDAGGVGAIASQRRVALFTHLTLTRFSLPFILRFDESVRGGVHIEPAACFVVGLDGVLGAHGSFDELLGVGAKAGDLPGDDAFIVAAREILTAPGGTDTGARSGAGGANERDRSQVLRIMSGLFAALRSDQRIIVVGTDTLQQVPAAIGNAFLDAAEVADKYVLIVYAGALRRQHARRPIFGEQYGVVLGEEGGVLAAGRPPWLAAHLDEVRALLVRERRSLRARRREAADDDESMSEMN